MQNCRKPFSWKAKSDTHKVGNGFLWNRREVSSFFYFSVTKLEKLFPLSIGGKMATEMCPKITLYESSRHAAKLVCIISTMCSLEKALDKMLLQNFSCKEISRLLF